MPYPAKSIFSRYYSNFPDSRRDDLTDSENAYMAIEPLGTNYLSTIILLLAVAAGALIIIVKRRGKK